MNKKHIICHYGEIALKGNNRASFEKQFVDNIEKALDLYGVDFGFVRRIPGRIIVGLEGASPDSLEAVGNTAGVVNFSPAVETGRDLDEISDVVLSLVEDEDFESFKVETKRSDKSYPHESPKINERLGADVVDKTGKEVDLDNPDLTIFVEIVKSFSGVEDSGVFVYTDKREGIGGLPVGSSGKAISLISGGIDSPVASYLACKRGIKPIFAHFHSYPHTSKGAIEKVKELVGILNKYSLGAKLYLIPFAEIQKSIISGVPKDMRIVFYRRFMLRIAERIAFEEGAGGLVTGESIGQVSSQTIENMRAIGEVAELPLLRPLVGFNKQEIVNLGKKIGTYETSIKQEDDTCTRFMPKSPVTKADIDRVREEEKSLDVESLVEKGVSESEIELVEGL